MLHQGNPDPQAENDHMDFIVLETIIDPAAGLWSAAEIQQTLGGTINVVDSINRLHGLGLVHTLGEFVFPTRAAVHSHALPR
jgi:hypothetical protein